LAFVSIAFIQAIRCACAPAFGRAEVMSLIRLPRAHALRYKYVAPAGLGRKPKR